MQRRRDEDEARWADQRAAAMKRRDERQAEDDRLYKEHMDRVAAEKEAYELRMVEERAKLAARKEEYEAS